MSTRYPKNIVLNKLIVEENVSDGSGIISAKGIDIKDTVYCKKLIVTDDLTIPSVNNDFTAKDSYINSVPGRSVNKNAGKLVYDARTKDLKVSNDTGESKNVTDSPFSIIKNTKYKEILMLEGWSSNDGTFTNLKQNNKVGIELDDHIYYQGSGYLVGINKGTSDGTTYSPISYMSRIDYFTSNLDSISNLSSQPVNYIGFTLINNISGDMEIEINNQGERPFLNFKVNSNSETKWFMVLYLQKVYIKNSLDKNNTDMVKYSTSDNNILYEPVYKNGSIADCIFKYNESFTHVTISPFSDTVVDTVQTYPNSAIDNSSSISLKDIYVNPDLSRREIISSTNTLLDVNSSSFDYNTYLYYNTLLIQPNQTTTKHMTSLYGHNYYSISNDSQHKLFTIFHQVGNTFTKNLTKEASDFATSYIDDDLVNNYYYQIDGQTRVANKSIRLVYQLKEREHKYKPILGITYIRKFSAKNYNDASESEAHRDAIFTHKNMIDVSEFCSQELALYKTISDFNFTAPATSVSKYISMTDNGIVNNLNLDVGTHNFIKSYISIRDITNNQSAVFLHHASVVIPSYGIMREYFTELREQDITNSVPSVLATMQTNIKNTFVNANTVINDIDENIVNDISTEKYTTDVPYLYVNSNSTNYIDNSEENTNELQHFAIEVETEPILSTAATDNIINGTLEQAYNSFAIQFPLKLKCTSYNSSKYQVYVLLEINKFNLDTY